jgi:hypothetical protein
MTQRSKPIIRLTLTLGALALMVVLGGCGPRNYLNENDKLRRQNLTLKREVDQLKQKLERRSGQIQVLQKRVAGPAQTQPLLDAPMLSQIELGQYSGPIDADGDGRDDTLRMYVRTLDQQGRMLPVAAEVNVKIVHIPEKGEPRDLAGKTYDAKAFDNAYRSAFTGEHYTFEVKLPDPLPENVDEVTTKVTLHHLTSDATFSKQAAYRLARP